MHRKGGQICLYLCRIFLEGYLRTIMLMPLWNSLGDWVLEVEGSLFSTPYSFALLEIFIGHKSFFKKNFNGNVILSN